MSKETRPGEFENIIVINSNLVTLVERKVNDIIEYCLFKRFSAYFRENLAQIIQAGQRVLDNPVYISDLGEYMTVLLYMYMFSN